MLVSWIKKRKQAQQQVAQALALALQAFERDYPKREVVHQMCRVLHQSENATLVQICWDWGGVPPNRSWWLVETSNTCRELSIGEAKQYCTIPVWR